MERKKIILKSKTPTNNDSKQTMTPVNNDSKQAIDNISQILTEYNTKNGNSKVDPKCLKFYKRDNVIDVFYFDNGTKKENRITFKFTNVRGSGIRKGVKDTRYIRFSVPYDEYNKKS
jgi:hypothetical protein